MKCGKKALSLLAEKKKELWKLYPNEKLKFDEAACVLLQKRPGYFFAKYIAEHKKKWRQYCYCKLSTECRVCEFKKLYADDEYVIYRNCFNLHFLAVFHRNMYHCLEELLKIKSHVACHLIFSKSKNTFDDWFTGKQNSFFLQETLLICINKNK